MRVRFALFAAVFGVVFLLSGLGLGISSYLAASATAGAQFGLAGLAGSNGGFRISIPLAKDSAVQDARVRSEIARTLVSDGAPVPITVRRDIETPDAVGLVGSHVVVRSALASVPDLSERARLTAGRWPRNAAEASMQADAARLLGVRVGDHFVLPGGAHITIVGLWHVRNEADPSWLGAEIPLSGIDDDGVSGFIVIDPSLWTNAESDPVARWTIIPRADRDTASQLDALQRAPDSVPLAIQTDPRNGTNVNQDGRLQPAMVPIINNVQAAAAVSTAPLVLVAVLGIVTLTELARMLGQLRSGETALLRARGATRRRLVLTTSAEATVIAVPAAAAGACVAAMILAATTSAFSLTSVGVIAAGATVAATVALMAAGAAFASPEDTRGLARDARIRSTVGTGAIALTVLAGVVAVSQFLLYGSPFTTSSSGGRALDPLAVAAPAFGLAALALIALALFPLVARAAERFARRDLGLAAVSARQLARRNRAALTPILLVSLATGSLVLACAYSGTWHDSYAQTRAVAIGTGVRVAGLHTAQPFQSLGVPGQTSASAAGTTDVQIGDSVVSMIEVPAASLAGVVSPVPGVIDPEALARDIAQTADRPQLPTGASGIQVVLDAAPASGTATAVGVTVVDAAGTLTTLLGTRPVGGTFALSLPRGVAPFVVRTIDLRLPPAHKGSVVRVSLRSTGANAGAIPLEGPWVLSSDGVGHPGYASDSGVQPGVRTTTATGGARVRLQPQPRGGSRLRVVISGSLAAAEGLKAGSTFDVPIVSSGGDVPAVVSAVVPAIPGLSTDDGALVDLGAVQDAELRGGLRDTLTHEWWIATNTPTAVARELAAGLPEGATTTTRAPIAADSVLDSANAVVWISGGVIALLALLAVAGGLAAEGRARTEEVSVLRALGIAGRRQSRGRVVEIGILLVVGIVTGLVDGIVVSALIVPGLARSAVPGALEALPTVLSLDPVPGVVALALLLAATGALLGAVGATVRRQAARTTSDEEWR